MLDNTLVKSGPGPGPGGPPVTSYWVTLTSHHSRVSGVISSLGTKTKTQLFLSGSGNTSRAWEWESQQSVNLRTSSLSDLTANSAGELSYVKPHCGHCVTLSSA